MSGEMSLPHTKPVESGPMSNTVEHPRCGRAKARIIAPMVASVMAIGALVVSPSGAATAIPGRGGPSMAADPVTGNVLLFGGRSGSETYLNDTWAWNGSVWNQLAPANSPSPRYGAGMAADKATGTIVLFGGSIDPTSGISPVDVASNETWTWSGTTKTWTEQLLLSRPEAREWPAMAYDAATKTVVMHGGTTNTDTWTWDGVAKTWTRHQTAVAPPARSGASMAYDPVSRKVVLFGGDDPCHATFGCVLFGDTWTWDGVAKTWTEESPATSPSARAYNYMAYHSPTQSVVLFGGGQPTKQLNDTWSWDGRSRNWTQQSPTTRPCGRSGGAMAYHAGTATAVIFGGGGKASCTPSAQQGDTWAWNGSNWKRRG